MWGEQALQIRGRKPQSGEYETASFAVFPLAAGRVDTQHHKVLALAFLPCLFNHTQRRQQRYRKLPPCENTNPFLVNGLRQTDVASSERVRPENTIREN